ncbi:uncharacterized protein AMSG_03704 [Thecamonas trahens ATCC 50062]|uniref:Transmembrane protein 135 N-terminal domain-containing protein n=1 Tax=Thecamonas trahens ATCC 50062 TaxID=461836 RepID=A0A0L0D4M9_THETB|nr:hypothetical protein AMSG_03704 [Thecamonas trahens ATCC 50062]KNC47274.1 hypothetical protein AMSG_03704 [Thecamonas trahens ATCC 50062]|eukprot:XP_013759617.1 hypothetical protein AMSG_03704 [Thecamonas trahens ATCC 50062]
MSATAYTTYPGPSPTFRITLATLPPANLLPPPATLRLTAHLHFASPATSPRLVSVHVEPRPCPVGKGGDASSPPLPPPAWASGSDRQFGAYLRALRPAHLSPAEPGAWRSVTFDLPLARDSARFDVVVREDARTSSFRAILAHAAIVLAPETLATPAASEASQLPPGTTLDAAIDAAQASADFVGGAVIGAPHVTIQRTKSHGLDPLARVFEVVVPPNPSGTFPGLKGGLRLTDDKAAGAEWVPVGPAPPAPLDQGLYPCPLGHRGYPCRLFWLARMAECFRGGLKFYAPIHLVPLLLFRPRALASPRAVLRTLLNICGSAGFVAAYNGIGIGLLCKFRNAAGRDAQIHTIIAGTLSGAAVLLEAASRRKEMALYCVPRALDAAWRVLFGEKPLLGLPAAVLVALLHALALGLTGGALAVAPAAFKGTYRSILSRALLM